MNQEKTGVKLIGTLDYGTGKVYCEEHERYDAIVFEGFLKDILQQYPTGKVIMILDNARIHHAKLLEPFLYKNKARLELVFLPPYSPELNLIDGLWECLKSMVLNSAFYPTLSRVSKAVQNFIAHINKTPMEIIDRLCIKM